MRVAKGAPDARPQVRNAKFGVGGAAMLWNVPA
jgi:hypothetical protein